MVFYAQQISCKAWTCASNSTRRRSSKTCTPYTVYTVHASPHGDMIWHDKWYKWSHLSRTKKVRKTSAKLPGLSWNNQIRWGCASSELIWSSWMQNDLAPVLSAFHSTEILTQSDKTQESTKCTKTVHGVGQSGLSTAIILLNCRSVIPKKKTLSLSLKPPACRLI